jgi:hypothetical protein
MKQQFVVTHTIFQIKILTLLNSRVTNSRVTNTSSVKICDHQKIAFPYIFIKKETCLSVSLLIISVSLLIISVGLLIISVSVLIISVSILIISVSIFNNQC